MGQILSQPVTKKNTEFGHDGDLAFAQSSMQGWRISMEDAHAAILDLSASSSPSSATTSTPSSSSSSSDHSSVPSPENGLTKPGPVSPIQVGEPSRKVAFFGVYDGHGGDKVAIFCGQNLHRVLATEENFHRREFSKALKDVFFSVDRVIFNNPDFSQDTSGCTATTVLIADGKVFCANAGDSRTVLGVRGFAKPLSFDHKPQNEGEKSRICSAGGFVEAGRVNGNLALSRAIGDFDFKKSVTLPPEEQAVTASPEMIVREITADDEFIVLACDGIWDCMSSSKVVEFVRRGITDGLSLPDICENLIDTCLAPMTDPTGIGCDNMTIMIVALLQGKTIPEWYQMVSERASNGDGPVAAQSISEMKGSKHLASTVSSLENESPAHYTDFEDDQGGDDNEDGGKSEDFLTSGITLEGGLSLQKILGPDATISNQNGTFVIHTTKPKSLARRFMSQGVSVEDVSENSGEVQNSHMFPGDDTQGADETNASSPEFEVNNSDNNNNNLNSNNDETNDTEKADSEVIVDDQQLDYGPEQSKTTGVSGNHSSPSEVENVHVEDCKQ